jgi:septum formation protein
MRVLLASSSPRRKHLLESVGFDLEILSPEIDETPMFNESAYALVQRLSKQKANACVNEGRLPVVAADTVVVLAGEILGKPQDAGDARRMLSALSGVQHEVLTGFWVSSRSKALGGVVSTRVWFRKLTSYEIDLYVDSREPLDRAGAYAIQERGAALVDRIEGSYTNVVGLPVKEVLEALEAITHDI